MSADGTYTTCAGTQCLDSPGATALTLGIGFTTDVGPYSCSSATNGVTCTANGKGFRISPAGVSLVVALG
jgi:hypothetical protein